MSTTLTRIPRHLDSVAFLSMQSAIAAQLQTEMLWPQGVAHAVAEYACPIDLVEIRAAIAFFEKALPEAVLKRTKQKNPEVRSAFEGIPCKPRHLFHRSFSIKNSDARRLIALAGAYLMHKNSVYLQQNFSKSVVIEKCREFYEFLNRIPGITIAERCNSSTDFRECHTYTFGHHDWYNKVNLVNTIFVHPKKVIDFLQSKGYTKSEVPSENQIAVYHTATKTNHFARVWTVEPDGKVILISKFAQFHIYTHAVGLVPYYYGNSVTFLNPPK